MIYCALVHHPVRDRSGEVVTTAITNLDVHDIARSARTYGLSGYFLVTPIDAQRRIVDRILEHWLEGDGLRRQPARGEALRLIAPVSSIEDAVSHIEQAQGRRPQIWATSARRDGDVQISFADARNRLADGPVLILFGTGDGLADAALGLADALLPPIRPGGYNHLSVRAAAAIILDRILGDGP